MRLFIAFKVPDAVKRAVTDLQEQLIKGAGDKVRLARSGVAHVTIAFLGEVSESDVLKLKGTIQHHLDGLVPFRVCTETIQIFPNPARPRVIVQAVKVESNIVDRRNKLCEELRLIRQMEDTKPWQPHLTIARVREGDGLRGFDPRQMEAPRSNWLVNQIGLYSSTLDPRGAKHTLLHKFSLK